MFDRNPPPSSDVSIRASRASPAHDRSPHLVGGRPGAAPGQSARFRLRKGLEIVVVAAAHDRPLAVLRHDEGERGTAHLPGWDRDAVFIVAMSWNMRPSQSSATVAIRSGMISQFGAAERGGDRVAAERHRVGRFAMSFSSPVGIRLVRKVTSI